MPILRKLRTHLLRTGFHDFLLQGALMETAIAVVIGVAFNNLVSAMVKDLITPLITAIGGQPDFGNLVVTVHNSQFRYGDFTNSVVSFLIIAATVYFFIAAPYASLRLRYERPQRRQTRVCPECRSLIWRQARRCAFCTADLREGTGN